MPSDRSNTNARHFTSAFPLNCWWVAATTEEVTRKPIARWLLERPVVLFRTEAGAPVALDDRCAHRWAPLSQGRLIGDEIACPYHGFRYNTAGVCTHVPTQSHRTAALKVRAYPIKQHGPFLWIWMGDPAKADPALLPSISWSTDPTDLRFGRHMEVQCSYVAAQENLMDLPHAPFLHSAADYDWREMPGELRWPIELHLDEHVLSRRTKFNESSPWPLDAELLGFDPGTKIAEILTATFTAPGCYLLESENEVLHPQPNSLKKYGYRGLHCTTPITLRRCHWWWSYTYDHGQHAIEEFLGFWDRILKEDKDLLESIQANIDRDTRDNLRQVLVNDDLAIGKLRRIIEKMLDAESPTQSRQIAEDSDPIAQA